ncbi:nitroreductase family deazaflavin-dependent oxidoreductase [Kineosporia babensis]|uniref:Nitroreductase family deazaflavin-dependent oxidoreductase n=1 Tax=Kineosporia babensis TaxID=499548 RepID=A0A9X1NDN2_9ACTN|nr:nitroreductase family deazaflavin-dependent oxidoreductase [Kineosporia babensis]MCD5311884.1 nitroreductase family deazaflavin-dependent oxidoreductase [Kineosporia babensis]
MSETVEFSPEPHVRRQTEQVLASGTTEMLTGPAPSVLLTVHGAKTGKLRYQLVIRVQQDDIYVVVASNDGSDRNPGWYYNIRAHPEVQLQDGTVTRTYQAREVLGEDKQPWWDLAVRTFPRYGEYQTNTERQIPVFVLEPKD